MTKFIKRRRRLAQPVRTTAMSRSFRGIPFLAALLIVGIAGFGFLYLRQVNGMTTDGLMVESLQKQVQALKQEATELELRVGKLRSLTTVEEASDDLGLVVRAQPKFLPAVGDSVALGQ